MSNNTKALEATNALKTAADLAKTAIMELDILKTRGGLDPDGSAVQDLIISRNRLYDMYKVLPIELRGDFCKAIGPMESVISRLVEVEG